MHTTIDTDPFKHLDPHDYILIKNAHLHNLKNIDVAIPKNQLTVITGLSGSGKSSLAFDTLYAEGQRRYVESLSSYARQFLGKIDKPLVDYIKGIAPAIAIQQKVNSTNPRSTVGTTTEIYDYLKIMYARIGITISPKSGNAVRKHTVTDVVNHIKKTKEGEKILICAPIHANKRPLHKQLQILKQQGYSRIKHGDDFLSIEESLNIKFKSDEQPELVIDRIKARSDEDFLHRVADSVQIAFYEGIGTCLLHHTSTNDSYAFSSRFSLDGMVFLEPSLHLFTFNNPYGACPKCEGFGAIIGIDESLVVPNTSLSIYEGAIACWKGEKLSRWKDQLINVAYKFDFPIHKPYYQLSEKEKAFLWSGNKHFKGINTFFEMLEKENYKIQNRILLSRYRGKTKCSECSGTRLRKETNYVKIGGVSINELVDIPIDEVLEFFKNLKLSKNNKLVADRLLKEILDRLESLSDLGLGYLTLNRRSSSLSGGESQRINLATSLGSSLVGSLYILDEPSIGLHPKDVSKLIDVLQSLKKLGNTVVVIEHQEEIIRSADYLIDIGPEAGSLGGQVVFAGNAKKFAFANTLTTDYLSGKKRIEIPNRRRNSNRFIEIKGAREFNLKNINVRFPLNTLTVVSGISGSGKSTLMNRILYPAMQRKLGLHGSLLGEFDSIEGDIHSIQQVEYINQNPIGKSSRSNPVTYIKAYDDIRSLFARTKQAKINGYQPKCFSFNVDGGRCDTCKGDGMISIEMQFMADVRLTCEQCHGKRFRPEILEIRFGGKNIADILECTVAEAIKFFEAENQTKIVQKLKLLQEVGLNYVTLGQSSVTLSGGEAQRVKLAFFLGKGYSQTPTLFIFDEPSTGLHFHDIKKLLKSFDALIDRGHSVLVIEHDLDMIKSADWVIDLGKEGGKKGGHLLFQGPPEKLIDQKESYTGRFLNQKLKMDDLNLIKK